MFAGCIRGDIRELDASEETFESWRVVQAFAIAKLSNNDKEKMSSVRRKRKRRGNASDRAAHD